MYGKTAVSTSRTCAHACSKQPTCERGSDRLGTCACPELCGAACAPCSGTFVTLRAGPSMPAPVSPSQPVMCADREH